MGKEELQELVAKLQDVCDALPSEEGRINNLLRLTSCMAKLKSCPRYSKRADKILDSIQDLILSCRWRSISSIESLISEVECLISELNETLEKESIFSSLKKGYVEAKDLVNEAIPEEMKDACKETVGLMKEMHRNAEKKVKSKIKNWLLSDDDE